MGMLISGIIGSVFVLVALLPSFVSVLKKHRAALAPEFVTFYFAGMLLLSIYAMEINDRIFLTLNSIAMIIAFVNFYYIPNKVQAVEKSLHLPVGRNRNAGKGKKRA
jgi:lipid-A-disaccharide synthase-like uncharacterized protein